MSNKMNGFRHALLAALLGASLLFSANAQSEWDLPDREIRIGFAAHSIDLQALFGQLREGFRATLDEAGLQYRFFQAAPENSGDHAGMVRILEDMGTLQLDYLLVGPTSLALNEPGLAAVQASGAKLLMTDYEEPEGGVPYADAVLNWVVYSHSEMGYKAGEWLADHFRNQGRESMDVVMLWGPAASEISDDRGNGVLRALEDSGLSINVVYEAYADFNREMAYNETERALAAYDFEAIVGMNSFMSVAAKDALIANGRLDDIVVVGMGGTIDELEAVAAGEVGAAPFRDPRSMGRASATALLQHLTGQADQIERTSYAMIPVVDSPETIREFVPSEMFDVDVFLNR